MRNHTLILIAAGLVLTAGAASAIDLFRVLNAEDLLEEGLAYFEAEEYEEAELKFKEAALEYPEGAENYYWLGRVFQEYGEFDKAKNYYDHSIKLDSAYIEALDQAARLMMDLRRFEESMTYLRRLADINPNEPETYSNLGYAHLGLGDYAKAEGHFETAIDLGGDQAKYYDGLGLAFDGQGRLPEAEQAFISALELDDERGDSHLHLALLYTRQGLGRQALDSFDSALEHLDDPGKRVFALFQSGVIHEQLGEIEQAVAAYNAALELAPESESAPAIQERIDKLGSI